MPEPTTIPEADAALDVFIVRWTQAEGGQERANYGLFLIELCEVLGVGRPDPAGPTTALNAYVFERAVTFREPDGSTARGRIDLYKRGCFVLEAKQSREKGGRKERAALGPQPDLFQADTAPRGRRSASRGWDVLMLNARREAEDYAKALPAAEGWPPFLLVCDVGHCLEVYADFTGQGKNYAQFPDRQGFRVFMEDLRDPAVRERLKLIWTDPPALDPTRRAARVTREIAARLAKVSKHLEEARHDPERVALFLMRCLFTMFAEDVELLPKGSFKAVLGRCADKPEHFPRLVGQLWEAMDQGGFAFAIEAGVKRFNGYLFKDRTVLPLPREEIGELVEAAAADWRQVEPAIFGTLLEQALDATERRKLGAHYTPRPYVERLVIATIMEPLRAAWAQVEGAAQALREAGDLKGAAGVVRAFHARLSATTVLDPACGTGNFLYVALELMKRLEGEVLEALADLGGQEALRGLERQTVDLHNFRGLELNPRAAEIAQLVLWIGYLQWHLRTRGGAPSEPILDDIRTIAGRFDAVLAFDRKQLARDAAGRPLRRGGPADGVIPAGAKRRAGTHDHDPGQSGAELVMGSGLDPSDRPGKTPGPEGGKDEAREVWRYLNPRRPEWPQADYIVGNPPFIGGKDIRGRLGDDYARALWAAHPHINESADYVMYWWDRAADILSRKGTRLKRFGLVTTNSITQDFSRRVIARHLGATAPLSLVMAIPDHPWTKATRGASAVRIAMTVAEAGVHDGVWGEVVSEAALDTDEPAVALREARGRINADLTVGADVTAARPLRANYFVCSPGVKLHGDGFIVTPNEAAHLGLGRRPGLERHIRAYRNGRDLTGSPRGVMVIDLFGLAAAEVRELYPEVYQHVLRTVKPERERNSRETYKRFWWIFGEPRRELRPALEGLRRYIATVETAKHRTFQFLDAAILPDNMLVAMGLDDAFHLAVLSSRIHVTWALLSGGTLEDRPRYSKSRVFDPFPFPNPPDDLKAAIRAKGEELDGHRKRVQAAHPDLTLTRLYNVLERLRAIAEERSGVIPAGAKRRAGTHDHDPGQSGAELVMGSGLDPEPAFGPRLARTRWDRPGKTPPPPPLTPAEIDIRDRGLVLILAEIHAEIDALAAAAYGWPADLADEDVIARLVALNHARAGEEKRGLVRWLRPDYQKARAGITQAAIAPAEEQIEADLAPAAAKARKPLFPTGAVDQVAAVMAALGRAAAPLDAATIAANFRQGRRAEERVARTLAALYRLGHLASPDGRRFALRRTA